MIPEYSNQVWSLKTRTVGNFVGETSYKKVRENERLYQLSAEDSYKKYFLIHIPFQRRKVPLV